MTAKTEKKLSTAGNAGKLDAGLLLARIEKQILNGEGAKKVRTLLRKTSLRLRLPVDDQLRWAELAQMAGETETAFELLNHIHTVAPENRNAWQQHLELFSILRSGKDFASLLGRARPHISNEMYDQWVKTPHMNVATEEMDIQAATVPFERYHQRMAALKRFMALFSGREGCFARQWANRKEKKSGYVPERRPLTSADLDEHLNGRKTYGIYLMQADGRIKTAVIDADLNKGLRSRQLKAGDRDRVRREAVHMISRIKELSRESGAETLVEFSGSKGYHFWYFFKQPEVCGPIRSALADLVQHVVPDLTAFTLEIFPKQDCPGGKGFGNLVKLPLGLHRVNGKRSFFLDCANRSVDAQLEFLSKMNYSSIREMTDRLSPGPTAGIIVHPRWEAWAKSYPELYRLQQTCGPLAQVMSLCLDGGNLSFREEKILYQTIGFLPDGRRLLHYLMTSIPEYNPHQVDYRFSRLRGTPLGCRRIHDLLRFTGPFCRFDRHYAYLHPLLHINGWKEPSDLPSKKVTDLNMAIEHLQMAIGQVQRFLK